MYKFLKAGKNTYGKVNFLNLSQLGAGVTNSFWILDV